MVTGARQNAERFAEELAALYGPRLRSVLLHGSVARGEAVPEVSDVNVLVLLDRVDPAALKLAGSLVRRWVEAGNTAPLLMAWDEWHAASDAFAIEAADMRDARAVLKGDDPLDGVPPDLPALRLQAERELRGKLVQLRAGLMVTGERDAERGRLLLAALPSFTTYFRTLLRLAGGTPPAATEEVIAAAAALAGFDAAPFLRAWKARGLPARFEPDAALVAAYHAGVERAIRYVDTLDEGEV